MHCCLFFLLIAYSGVMLSQMLKFKANELYFPVGVQEPCSSVRRHSPNQSPIFSHSKKIVLDN